MGLWTYLKGQSWTPTRKCPAVSTLFIGGLALALVTVGSTRFVRLNVSPSVPVGFYRLAPVPAQLTPGQLVLVPVPPAVQAWAHLPLLKPVAAVEGGEVCMDDGVLLVNGMSYGVRLAEAQGKPLPQIDGCQKVPRDHVFLASHAAKSLDGRYMGMTPVASITAQAIPLFTWRE